jgi:hypothetical protein
MRKIRKRVATRACKEREGKKKKSRIVEIHKKGELQEEHAKTEERNMNRSNP